MFFCNNFYWFQRQNGPVRFNNIAPKALIFHVFMLISCKVRQYSEIPEELETRKKMSKGGIRGVRRRCG